MTIYSSTSRIEMLLKLRAFEDLWELFFMKNIIGMSDDKDLHILLRLGINTSSLEIVRFIGGRIYAHSSTIRRDDTEPSWFLNDM